MGRSLPYVDSSWPSRSKGVGELSKPCNATAGSDLIWSAPATTAGDPSMPSATPSPATPGCHPPQHDQLKNTPDWIPPENRWPEGYPQENRCFLVSERAPVCPVPT